jgi:DNA-binding XRE family transcriptional regulator
MPELLQVDRSAAARSFPAYSAISAMMLTALVTVGTGGVADPRHLLPTNGTTLNVLSSSFSIENMMLGVGDDMSLPSLIARVRANFALTTVDLANALDVSRQTVYDWISERQQPQVDKQQRLCILDYLGIIWQRATGLSPTDAMRKKYADKPQLLMVLGTAHLDRDNARIMLLAIANARASVPSRKTSIASKMQQHGYEAATENAQQIALNDAEL